MKRALSLLSLAAGLMMAPVAKAGLLVEPNMSYELSVLELKNDSLGEIGGAIRGLGVGARVGYTFPALFWVAADYSMLANGTFDTGLPGASAKMNRSNLYVDVGVDFPILLRAWFGYGLANSAKIDFTGADDLEMSGGSAYKLGIGVTSFPFVSINFEYFQNDYKTYKWGSNEGDVSSAFGTFKDTGFKVGVSLPLDL